MGRGGAKRYKPGGYDSYSGRYTTDGAMRDSNSQFSVSFYAKFFSCVLCSLFIVGGAFTVMNTWLSSIPAHARGPMMQNGGGSQGMMMGGFKHPGMSADMLGAGPGAAQAQLGAGFSGGNTFALPKHAMLPELKGSKRVKHYHVKKS